MTSAFVPVASIMPSLMQGQLPVTEAALRPRSCCRHFEYRASVAAEHDVPAFVGQRDLPAAGQAGAAHQDLEVLSSPVELIAIMPVFWTVPPNGRIAPSPTVIVLLFVLSGSVSNTKLLANSAQQY